MGSQNMSEPSAYESADVQPTISQQPACLDTTDHTAAARRSPARAPARPTSAFRHMPHTQQRSVQAVPSLQSPFAASDAQRTAVKPEEVQSAVARKRPRGHSLDLDSKPASKVPHLADGETSLAAATLQGPTVVTLHKPTPHRPTAATPCCFGVVSASRPQQHSQLSSSALNAAQPPSALQSAPGASVSPAIAATPAKPGAGIKQPKAVPAEADKGSPARAERSLDLKTAQGPTASDSSEVVSDNSQQMSAQPHVSHIQASASIPHLAHICSPPSIQHIPTPAYTHPSSFLQTQHLMQNQPLLHTSIRPFTTYSCPTTAYSTPGSLAAPTTYVVVSGNSPKRSADKYVAAVVQDAQGNSQHVTVAASAISTGGPSYVLPTTLAVPFTPITPMVTQQALAFGSAGLSRAQHLIAPSAFGQSLPGLGAMNLGAGTGLPGMGLGLPNGFNTTQAGYNMLPQVPPAMLPSIHVNMQDKASCVMPSTNVRIY